MSLTKEKKRLSGDERKKQILKHTADLVALKGFKSVSIRDIARAAGINESLIYKHFSSKDELLVAIYEEYLSRAPKYLHIPETEAEFIQMLSKFEESFLYQNMNAPNELRTLLYVILDEYDMPSAFSVHENGSFLNWLNTCISKGKDEWDFDKNVINEVYISLFMGSMIYFTLQNSISGIFNVKTEKIEGIFSRMLIKSLKK